MKEWVLLRYSVFLAAGIATTPDFFTTFGQKLVEKFSQAGVHARIFFQFPYGDSERRLAAQTYEVQWDMRLPFASVHQSIGGERLRQNILRRYAGERLFLIGHSAGGVASCHAAYMLEKLDGIPVQRIIQIGSPKIRIFPALQKKCAYLKGIGSSGCDRICRLGSWAGWEFERYIPYWRKDKYAPSLTAEVRLIGGHADYFRDLDSFCNDDGVSNLQKTLNFVWDWLDVSSRNIGKGEEKTVFSSKHRSKEPILSW